MLSLPRFVALNLIGWVYKDGHGLFDRKIGCAVCKINYFLHLLDDQCHLQQALYELPWMALDALNSPSAHNNCILLAINQKIRLLGSSTHKAH